MSQSTKYHFLAFRSPWGHTHPQISTEPGTRVSELLLRQTGFHTVP